MDEYEEKNPYQCRWCDERFPMPILRDIHELKHIEEEDKKAKCLQLEKCSE